MSALDHLICWVLFLGFLGWVVWTASKEYRTEHPEIQDALVGFINRWFK
jgi:hypothetical protein